MRTSKAPAAGASSVASDGVKAVDATDQDSLAITALLGKLNPKQRRQVRRLIESMIED